MGAKAYVEENIRVAPTHRVGKVLRALKRMRSCKTASCDGLAQLSGYRACFHQDQEPEEAKHG